MRLFHERGFGSVGVDLIGESAGMSGPAIYRYFSGKEEILVVLLDEAIDYVLTATGGIYDDPEEQLRALVRGHVSGVLQQRELMGIWTRERNSIPKQYRARLRPRINRYIDRWVDCLQRCYPDRPRDSIIATVHMTHGMIDSASSWPPRVLKMDQLEELMIHVALAGLASLSSLEADG